MVNDVRRVYTDGRGHTPEDDAYPSWNGDTIGFWDGDVLVAHTTYLMKGQYQRGVQPNYSEKTTVVERWFPDFTFVPNDAAVSSDPAVKKAQKPSGTPAPAARPAQR
jgi:hypothetical protein